VNALSPGNATATAPTITTNLSTAQDLVDKRGDYAEGRVSEYWIVNLQSETITVLHLRADAYEEAGTYGCGESAVSTLLAGFSVAIAAVFNAD
jgi:Uma2 family endonuclease